MPLCRTISADLAGHEPLLRRARYGVIETAAGALAAVHLRPWPKLLSLRELWPVGDRYHARGPADRCRLYYNQPRGSGRYLALRYVATTAGTSYATFTAALRALDAIAEIKRADALVCDAANARLSDRFMRRMGWAPHAPMPWRRNFIRRFYGVYPSGSAGGAEPAPTGHANP
ncbi:MAG: hypothetical protein AAF790_14680 [Planctomycetota bacterium]